MTQAASAGARFRAALKAEKPLQIIGAINAYHAMLATQTGFKALYLSGGGVAAGSLGLPDLGISTLEDVLIDVFQFKSQHGASYVTDRRTVSYFTPGSNIYQSGSGTKIVRINVTSDGWLDPGSVRLHYTLIN